jgi:hypothetical protein
VLQPLEPNEFRRATANIEQNGACGTRINQWRAPGCSEACLGLAIYHLEPKAKFVRHTIQKLRAVFSGSARLGRNQARAGNTFVFHFISADGQSRHRAADRGLAQAARRRDTLPEPYDS